MKKMLPIKIDNSFTTECWSYFRFAIIDSYENLQNWKYINYNSIFCDNKGNIFFGENALTYDQLRHYNEVLSVYGYSYKQASNFNIIKFIKNMIYQNKYVILECNYSKLFDKKDFNVHEILIYGYDDQKKVFYSPIFDGLKSVKNNKSGWEIKEISFDKVDEAFKDMYLNKYNNKKNILIYKRFYHYPITVVSPKQSYYNSDNIYILYTDIYNICESDLMGSNFNLYNFFNGYLSCYRGLINAGEKIILGKDEYYKDEYKYYLNIRKLINSRENLIYRIEMLLNKENISFVDTNFLEIKKSLEICFNLAIKYTINSDKKIIENLIILLKDSYKTEKKSLNYLKEILKEFVLKN